MFFQKRIFGRSDSSVYTNDTLSDQIMGWCRLVQANIAFVQSQGYSLSNHITAVQQERLVVWGCNDKKLESMHPEHNSEAVPRSKLVWVEDCGHCNHLEQ